MFHCPIIKRRRPELNNWGAVPNVLVRYLNARNYSTAITSPAMNLTISSGEFSKSMARIMPLKSRQKKKGGLASTVRVKMQRAWVDRDQSGPRVPPHVTSPKHNTTDGN